MGCDIHTFLERRLDGNWICATPRVTDEDGEATWDDPYNERRSSTFAVLAGVRNGDDVRPIDQPRGIPTDLSAEGRARVDADDGCHSHGWLTLRDLLDFDWTRPLITEGSVTHEELEARVAAGSIDKTQCYVRPDSSDVFYPAVGSYAEACEYFLGTVIPKMLALGEPEDVRMVFYFDG